MSVVVRMEMPRVCITENGFYGYCPMDRVWCIQRNAPPDITMREAYEAMTDKIPLWCPIICSLPEGHGRLIDADVILQYLREKTAMFDAVDGKMELVSLTIRNDLQGFIKTILETPTIVPAERGE